MVERKQQQLILYYTNREIKAKILGMRGEEWGKIVVDGTSRNEQPPLFLLVVVPSLPLPLLTRFPPIY